MGNTSFLQPLIDEEVVVGEEILSEIYQNYSINQIINSKIKKEKTTKFINDLFVLFRIQKVFF